MRDVKQAIKDAWAIGDFTGDRRPIGRVTIQQGKLKLHDVGYNVYATVPFGLEEVPRELPNVKSISWDRDVQAEIATCTLELYNTEPLPIGAQVSRRLDQPGYFTFNRGKEEFSARWGHTPNEWSGKIVPDNIVRTFEGYGFSPEVCPEDDPHLEQTGVWMIDDVEYQSDGIIRVTMRDIGRILIDQIIFPPVAPDRFYPLLFTKDPKQPAPGFVPGKTVTRVVTSGGDFDRNNPPPQPWAGPTDAPEFDVIEPIPGGIRFSFKAKEVTQPGYRAAGYQVVVDNVRLTKLYAVGGTYELPLMNGNVYLVNPVVIYENTTADARGIKARQVSNRGTDRFVSPRSEGSVPTVVSGSLVMNTDLDGNNDLGETHPGSIRWQYTGTGESTTWSIIYYRTEEYSLPSGRRTRRYLRRVVEQVSSPAQTAGQLAFEVFETDAPDLQDGSTWNVLVFGKKGEPSVDAPDVDRDEGDQEIGGGDLSFRSRGGTGEFYGPPESGGPPEASARVVTTSTTTNTQTVITPPKEIRLAYDNSSNDYYDGANDNDVHGHNPRDAFDANPGSYFLSVGNSSPGRGFAFEWAQGTMGGEELVGVKFSVVKTGYRAYVSVFARGQWVRFKDADNVPYDPKLPQSHNGANIPYAATTVLSSEGPHTVIFAQPIPGATKVRVTLGNLQDFGIGPYRYRGAIREMSALIDPPDTGTATATSTTTVQGPVVDFTDPVVVQTYTDKIEPYVQGGVGQYPGKYHDYTDIVKLFCAWAGFFWPNSSNGGETEDGRLTRLVRDVRSGATDLNGIRAMVDAFKYKNTTDHFESLPVPEERDAPHLTTDANLRARIKRIFENRGVPIATFVAAPAASMPGCNGPVLYDYGKGPYGLPSNVDPVLGDNAGRVWGDFEQTGTAGKADLKSEIWDKKSLLDGIIYVREIIGFLFYIDETGAVVWRAPNIYSIGNDVATLTQQPRRTTDVLVLDENQQLLGLGVKLQSRNVRERIFIASSDGRAAAMAAGYNPNPIGLRRVGGWTDQNFESAAECLMMADFIALRQLFSYRTNQLQVPGYPAIQINDQVQIFEETTEEGFYHYVKSINSTLDMETGEYTYSLGTHWLGQRPFDRWVFHPKDFAAETAAVLEAIGRLPNGVQSQPTPVPTSPTPPGVAPPLPTPPPPTTGAGVKVQRLIRVDGTSAVYITDGIYKRWVRSEAERSYLGSIGIVSTIKVELVSQEILDNLSLIGPPPPVQ